MSGYKGRSNGEIYRKNRCRDGCTTWSISGVADDLGHGKSGGEGLDTELSAYEDRSDKGR